MPANDRIFVSSSFMGDAESPSCEVSWAAASSGIFCRGDRVGDVDGELLVHADGRATLKFWEGERGEERCFVVVVDPGRKAGGYVRVFETEDQPPDEGACPLLWDSGSVPESTVTVWVVAFQHREQGEGVGGFDWRLTRAEVDAIEAEREASGFYGPEYEHAVFPFQVPAGLSNDETTDYVDGGYVEALCAVVAAAGSEGVS